MSIEEEFFKTFGIEPKTKYYCPKCKSVLEDWWYGGKYPSYECSNQLCDYETYELRGDFKNLYKEDVYPPITDRILLELICILNRNGLYGYSDWGGNYPIGETVEELKNSILNDCITHQKTYNLYKQVRSLFEGVEE